MGKEGFGQGQGTLETPLPMDQVCDLSRGQLDYWSPASGMEVWICESSAGGWCGKPG